MQNKRFIELGCLPISKREVGDEGNILYAGRERERVCCTLK